MLSMDNIRLGHECSAQRRTIEMQQSTIEMQQSTIESLRQQLARQG